MTRAVRESRHAVQVVVAAAIFVAGVTGFSVFAAGLALPLPARVSACLVFALLFMPCPVLGVERWSAALREWTARAQFRRVSMLWILALAAWAAHGWVSGALQASSCIRPLVQGLVVIALVSPPGAAGFAGLPALRLALAVLGLWLPVEFGWAGGASLPAGVAGIGVSRLLSFDLALVLFVSVAPVGGLGYRFDLRLRDLRDAGLAFAACAAVLVPLGISIGFIHFGMRRTVPVEWGEIWLVTYFLVGLPEELLFRGLVQNAIDQRWRARRGRLGALLVASVIFGASHLNNPPAPNFRYALLATLAGVAYGWVWIRTRRLTASALTHAAVDWVWVVMFRAR